MVSCRTISESTPTHQSGDVQKLRGCSNKSSSSRDGQRHTCLPHGPQIGRIARERLEFFEGTKPQESGDLVYQMLDDRSFER